jgi:tripartite-type tricarboxylate transporter receptor subunit TctC
MAATLGAGARAIDRILRIGVLALLGSPVVSPAVADPVAEFYAGKRLSLVIGYGVGGGYDLYARTFARHLGEHLPGKPTVVPQNMPGAGSRRAANWLYNAAPRDGTVIATLGQNTPTDQVLGEAGVQFDVRRFNWIGNFTVANNTFAVWHATGVRRLADARGKELAIGATGASSPSVLYPQLANNLFGTRFKIITGYRGGGDINLAMERGELDGRGSNSWSSWKSTRPEWVRDGKIHVLFQVGPRREPDLPDAPLLVELARTEEQRQVLALVSGDVAVGRPIVAPPDVPAERVAALRKAFDDTVNDPRFVADAAQQKLDLSPIGGEELQRIVTGMVALPPEVVARVKAAIAIKDAKELDPDRKSKAGPSEGSE